MTRLKMERKIDKINAEPDSPTVIKDNHTEQTRGSYNSDIVPQKKQYGELVAMIASKNLLKEQYSKDMSELITQRVDLTE